MSSKKKRFAKGLGASALAVATIASGLSFGTTAATAVAQAPVIDPEKPAHSSTYGALYGKYGNGYIAYTKTGTDLYYSKFNTADEARDAAVRVSVPTGSFAQQLRVEGSELCLSLASTDFVSCDPSDSGQRFFVEDSSGPRPISRPNSWLVPWGSALAEFSESGEKTDFAAPFFGFHASVDSVDLAARRAIVSGYGEPGADVIVQWGDEREDDTEINEDGEWDFQLDKLKLGSNPVTLLQYVDGEATAEYDLDVELKIADLVVNHKFGANRDDLVSFSGTAEPGAVVQVFDKDERMIAASDPAHDITGTWSLEIPAPNKGGEYDLDVYQSIQGERASKTHVSVDYGQQLIVKRPDGGFVHPGGDIKFSGNGEPKATVEIYEGKRLVGGPVEVRANTNWDVFTDLDAGEHHLTVTQKSKGGNTQTDTVIVNEGESSVPAPEAEVVFDQDVTKRANITGSAQDGATVTVRDERNAVVGSPQVINGRFTLPLTGAFGSHTHTVTQTVNWEPSEATEVVADYGQAVEITATNNNGIVTVSGTSSQGAKLTLTSGGRELAAFDVTNTDGTFSRELTGLGQGNIVITATAQSKGALSSTDSANLSLPVVPASITFTSHPNRTFTPGEQVFAGKGTPGTTVTLNPFGWEAAYASANLTTTVNQFGDWEIKRGLGNTTYALFSVKQTTQQGVTNELNTLNMRPFAEVGEPADLTVNFTAGDFFTPGEQTFTGRATPGAQVTLNPFGFRNPAYAGYSMTVLADSTTGQWSIPRSLGNTTYREVAVKQESADASKANLIENIFLAPVGWLGDPADLVDTTQATSHTPGESVTFTGTARPGTTVTLYPFGEEHPDYALTTTVKATGTWSITRQLGNQVFPIVVTQANADGKTDRFTHTMTPNTK